MPKPTYAELQAVLATRERELAEARGALAGAQDVLRAINDGRGDAQAVLDAIVERALALLSADAVGIQLRHQDATRLVANRQAPGKEGFPLFSLASPADPMPATWGTPSGRAIARGQSITVDDTQAAQDEYPDIFATYARRGIPMRQRSSVVSPLLLRGEPVGVLSVHRYEVQPFTPDEVRLLETFAAQAVVAIENARLFQELNDSNASLKESLEQQTATSDVLATISRSPTDLQRVLDAVADSAARLCGTDQVLIRLVMGDTHRAVAGIVGGGPRRGERVTIAEPGSTQPLDRDNPPGRAILDREVVHIADVQAVPVDEMPAALHRSMGIRTFLGVPLRRQGEAIGVITMGRGEVRPFADRQIALVKLFADQAVIAIENARLFQELQERNAALSDALERQTATAEVLQAISRAPTDLREVLDTIAASAVRLCGAVSAAMWHRRGDTMRFAGAAGPDVDHLVGAVEPVRWESVPGRAILERRVFHIPDILAAAEEFPHSANSPMNLAFGIRTFLAVPLVHGDQAIGAISLIRREVAPFSDGHVALVSMFAAQAAIAIENARLFSELQERLEEQTATAAVLETISRSPTDLQGVLDAIAESATRLCGGVDTVIFQGPTEDQRPVAHFGVLGAPPSSAPSWTPENSGMSVEEYRAQPRIRAAIERRTVHVPDLANEPSLSPRFKGVMAAQGVGALLQGPLLRGEECLGVISVRRAEASPFTERQIAVLETFADQAVIAIENARLFQELQDRLEEQTATSDVLRAISESPGDLEPVLRTVGECAARLCDAAGVFVYRVESGRLVREAGFGAMAGAAANVALPLDRSSVSGQAVLDRRTVQLEDVAAAGADHAVGRELQRAFGFRTGMATPLVRAGEVIGAVSVLRMEVRPFNAQQIQLLETFASQAAIAIENARLFSELQERLEEQTATSAVLRAISESPTDVQPVLETLVENAMRICATDEIAVHRVDGDELENLAARGTMGLAGWAPWSSPDGTRTPGQLQPGQRARLPAGSLLHRAVHERRSVQVGDLLGPEGEEFPVTRAGAQEVGYHAMLATPMLLRGEVVGAVIARNREAGLFTERQVRLLEGFANQAAIAMENARLFRELNESNAGLREALEQQTVTADVLEVISRSPTDLQRVLDTIADSAARLCGTDQALIRLVEGNVHRAVAGVAGVGPRRGQRISIVEPGSTQPLSRDNPPGRAIIDREVLHIPDLQAVPIEELPATFNRALNGRTWLGVPLLRQGQALGVIVLGRGGEVRPFTERQIALVKTFADQAVIAIDNARLFGELTESNASLRDALEQQTATAEVLATISRSPTDLQGVLDTIAESAARLCGAADATIARVDSDGIRLVAGYGPLPKPLLVSGRVMEPGPGYVYGRVLLAGAPVQLLDPADESGFVKPHRRFFAEHGIRTVCGVPLMRRDEPVGVILLRREEREPFTDRQVALLKTFADQAVIAIENARLFSELQERTEQLTRSVERLTALFEVGQAVGGTLDLQQVLDTVVARASDLAGADGGAVYEYDGEGAFDLRATHQMDAEVVAAMREARVDLGSDSVLGQAGTTRQPVQVQDILAGDADRPTLRALKKAGYRAVMAVPLLRENGVVGALVVRRKTPGAFDPDTVALLQTFANQSALAIQNARLFQELAVKSQQLEEASAHKSEFLANMSHELRTPLNAIIGFTEVLLEKYFGEVNEKQEDYLKDVLSSGQHLLALINDILDLSKVEAGRMELEVASFDLGDALEAGLVMVKERASKKGIALALDLAEDLGRVEADERKVKQVVFNLLTNAVKFTPEGGRVTVSARRVDGRVEVAVADTGVGIPPEALGQIFEEFGQARNQAGQTEGTGLGLTLVKRFVELHGGAVSVESTVGHGSTFGFSLPATRGG